MSAPTLEIELLPILQDNYVYLLFDPDTGISGVVDPGVDEPVRARLTELGRSLDFIFITHHHADHVGGVPSLRAHYGARLIAARKDQARIPGFTGARDVGVVEGDEVVFGGFTVQVLETPGHTRGHLAFWFPRAEALFCGDTLFAMGCGRLFEGTAAEMWASLTKLAALPPATRIFCGHEYTLANARFAVSVDPDNRDLQARLLAVERLRAEGRPTIPSTMELELRTNPFLRVGDPALRARLGMLQANDVEVFAELRRRKDRF